MADISLLQGLALPVSAKPFHPYPPSQHSYAPTPFLNLSQGSSLSRQQQTLSVENLAAR